MPLSSIFRTIGAWGAGKGSNLTPAEVDGNFWAIKQFLDNLEANPPAANEIVSIVQTGDSITVFLADSTSFGPFALPTATPIVAVGTIADPTYVLLLGDRGKYWRCTNAGGCVVSIPSDAELAFPIGTEFYFRQAAAGAVIFDASTDIVLNGVDGFLDETAAQGAMATLKKVAADEWDLFGLLAADHT